MKKLLALTLALLALLLAGCPTPVPGPGEGDYVIGVTITGAGVTGTGASKTVTVMAGAYPLDLDVTVTKSGNPDVTETWESLDSATVSVVDATGQIQGHENSSGVQVKVTVGGKSDAVTVRVVELVGATLEFDTGTLEWYSLDTTNPFIPGMPVIPTVVRNGNIITASNTDGTFKESETLQGSSYLLVQQAIDAAQNFEIRAAVKITLATAGSDKYSCGVGMFVPDGVTDKVVLDSPVAVMAKRSKSTPDMRSLYSKSNSATGDIGAGSPNISSGVILTEYHTLSLTRVGANVTFGVDEQTAVVNIDDGVTTTGMLQALGGEVKAGMYFAGVTAEIEGLVVNTLQADGVTVDTELYKLGDMPPIPVFSIDTTGPGGVQSSTIDMSGLPSTTLQLSTAITPSYATGGTDITYSVQGSGDANVSVDGTGLVTITGAGDGSATILATSGNGKTDTYVITLVDSSQDVTSISIPLTLSIYEGQSKTISPVTVLPVTAGDKSVTWFSSNEAINVDASGLVTVDPGTDVGTTANVTATSVHTPAVVSNTCVVSVVTLPVGTPLVYSFPSENWGGNANWASWLASNATVDGAVGFLAKASATPNPADGLSYKSIGASNLQLRYSVANGNAVNYNGSSLLTDALPGNILPADGSLITGGDASLSRYIQVPLTMITSTDVKVDLYLKPTSTAAGKIALLGVSGDDRRVIISEATTSSTARTISWTFTKGSYSAFIICFSREGLTTGGLDVRTITVTPQ